MELIVVGSVRRARLARKMGDSIDMYQWQMIANGIGLTTVSH